MVGKPDDKVVVKKAENMLSVKVNMPIERFNILAVQLSCWMEIVSIIEKKKKYSGQILNARRR